MYLPGKSHSSVTTLEVDSVWLEYANHRILQNVYLRVDKGQLVGLLGRNGCGKTSLLEIIYGIRTSQNNSVRIDGTYMGKLYRHRGILAYLPQKQFVPGHLTVRQAFHLYQSDPTEASAYFPELAGLLSYRFDDLSGGQKRLAEISMVLSSPAPFIILDEPFSNVMPLHVETLKTWLVALKARKGILMTDHSYLDVLAISDRLYLLNMHGRTIPLEHPIQQLRDFGYIR
ncbi:MULTISPECIES: ATP-binding cassette domain-containing protein [unclassified Spirosoma]|mgnify:CR=1 FL=1|uniref:ATP-binding cassette domain-containing protein n=1 Tax=unclassified Spirosoma TaxID=2621999 RepID=UPI000960D28C|nr:MULTISPECIES: ATP-binding cassette domain-containing protein [unclassified Spirosoma]MBN8824538.1 ATP-binding cassette domain-containing protein [Spirosoma sp.]OJW70905.1 MAG: ABC transporter ATP-binding protein [Spirosoma sp. 48-14]